MAESKVAIVTGGSRGIGRAVAEALLREGWRVHICSKSPESVARALSEMGGAVEGQAVDVRDEGAVEDFVRTVAAAEGGRLDLLVNNAGLGVFGPVDELSGDTFRAVVETNLLGAFYCLRAAARVMKPRGEGWIVNIASLAGKNAMAGGAAYNASKFGLVGLSEAAMLDLRPHGVRVAAILPGSVDTEFGHPSGQSGGKGAGQSWRLQPEDVAAMVLHLLTYPPNALPSLVEMRPTRPPKK
ncbi:MAG TPA: SDR family oxidoreductase [Thermoanaerobaculia bacterium]|jgi:NAD(P)-dependent dehydrogenase (short-subunit alcohol dehydrogenase family)|nr:SDR family oxidoreductase [Thermoanaerobaculia bacterium]